LYERKEDIAPLAFFFLQHFCQKYSRMKVLTENVIASMLSYDWPGNVRELKNFIERLVVTSPDTDLQIDTIPKGSAEHHFSGNNPMFHPDLPKQTNLPIFREAGFSHRVYMEQCEKQLLQDALAQFKKPAKVAEALDLDLSNVYRKMRKYHLAY
jgi:DNA-binding NtrC family response regulator